MVNLCLTKSNICLTDFVWFCSVVARTEWLGDRVDRADQAHLKRKNRDYYLLSEPEPPDLLHPPTNLSKNLNFYYRF